MSAGPGPVRCALGAPGGVWVRAGGAPRLPAVAARDRFHAETGWLAEALLGAHGVDATVLRRLEPPAGAAPLALLEPIGTPPEGWRCVPVGALAEPDWVREALAEALGEPPPGRPAHQRPGWRDAARAWAAAELARLGRRLVALEPLRSWSVSSLWRAHAEGGDAFLKGVPAIFAREPAFTRWLGARFPGAVPATLAGDPAGGRLLLDAVPGEGLRAVGPAGPAGLARLASGMAALQRAAAADPAALLAAGAADRREPAAAWPELVEAVGGRLEPAERARLPAVAVRLDAAGQRVAALGLPPTLVHGDLHPGNALGLPDRVVLLDWSDAALAPPWADLFTLLGWGRYDEARHAAACDAWGEAWGLEPAALRRALPDLLALGAAYHAESYEVIRRGQEPGARWELGDAPVALLRRLLEDA